MLIERDRERDLNLLAEEYTHILQSHSCYGYSGSAGKKC